MHEVVGEGRGKGERRQGGEDGEALDSILLHKAFRASFCGGKLNFVCLINELGVCAEGETLGIIGWDGIRLACKVGMSGTIKGNIVDGIPRIRYSDPMDLAHATQARAIVALHAHNHGYGWNVTKDQDEICTESEEHISEGVVCVDSYLQLKKLLDQRPEKQVEVGGLLRTWDDTNADEVLEVVSDLWPQVIIHEEKRPHHLCTLFEWCKAVH